MLIDTLWNPKDGRGIQKFGYWFLFSVHFLGEKALISSIPAPYGTPTSRYDFGWAAG
jgi:hypothetical protein